MTAPYWNPTQRILSEGALSDLGEVASGYRPEQVLLVLGRSSFRQSSHYTALKRALAGFALMEAEPVVPSPSIPFVQQMWDAWKGKGIGLVVGVGGGSVIDCAKALRILLTQEEGTLEEFARDARPFAQRGLPFIAVPTTAGTGSEVTPYASLQTTAHQKISLTHPWLFPDVALIDPMLTHSMPRYVTACSGLDALAQAVESFWSVHHTPFSETHSVRAISLILENFETVLKEPSHRKARFAMSAASTEAGLAITQTRTTAVHAVSYPLTTFFDIPHGHACALTLPSFIRYNGPILDPDRGATLWKTMGCRAFEEAARAVERLMDAAGVERSLRKLGLDPDGIQTVIDHGFRSDRVVNNPREVTQEALREILERIY